MISRKKYLEAKAIVEKYESKQNLIEPTNFEIGDKVVTTKGCQYKGSFSGVVVGYGKWRDFDGTKVKKDNNGKVVLCLTKNLRLLLK